MKKITFGLFAITLLVVNVNNEAVEAKYESLSLQNIGFLQANATEMWCDAKNEKECTIGTAKATGFLHAKD